MKCEKCIVSVSYSVVCFVKTFTKYTRNAKYEKCIASLRTATFINGVLGYVVPSFTTKDLIAAQIKCGKGKDQKDVVVCSVYFLSNSVEIPYTTEFKELEEYCSEKKNGTPGWQ